jgi:hypothetical protein
MQRAPWGHAWLSIVVLALWGTTAAAVEMQLVYVGPTTGTVWRGVEQGLREANTLGGFTGHSYTIQPVAPETLLAAEGGPLPMAVLAATDAATLHQLSTKFATAGVAILNLAPMLTGARTANPTCCTYQAHMKADAGPMAEEEAPGQGASACLARRVHRVS